MQHGSIAGRLHFANYHLRTRTIHLLHAYVTAASLPLARDSSPHLQPPSTPVPAGLCPPTSVPSAGKPKRWANSPLSPPCVPSWTTPPSPPSPRSTPHGLTCTGRPTRDVLLHLLIRPPRPRPCQLPTRTAFARIHLWETPFLPHDLQDGARAGLEHEHFDRMDCRDLLTLGNRFRVQAEARRANLEWRAFVIECLDPLVAGARRWDWHRWDNVARSLGTCWRARSPQVGWWRRNRGPGGQPL
jgi:hypothetical protein